jgi:hypothetical protein
VEFLRAAELQKDSSTGQQTDYNPPPPPPTVKQININYHIRIDILFPDTIAIFSSNNVAQQLANLENLSHILFFSHWAPALHSFAISKNFQKREHRICQFLLLLEKKETIWVVNITAR